MAATSTNISVTEKFGPWQFLISFLSLFTLGSLGYEEFAKPAEDIRNILNIADYVICAFFLMDFGWQFQKAKNKFVYLKWGWIDFISSIPAFPFLMWARVFRFARLLRVATTVKSWRQFVHNLFQNPAYGTSILAIATIILVLFMGAIVILEVETDPNSNIHNASDALWWSVTTITTVGYGDKYPVTDLGRFCAAILMFVGIGVYGTVTGLFATWFISPRKS